MWSTCKSLCAYTHREAWLCTTVRSIDVSVLLSRKIFTCGACKFLATTVNIHVWIDSGWVLAITYGIYHFFLCWAIRKPCQYDDCWNQHDYMVTDDNVEYPRVGAILVGCWVLTTTWNTHVLGRFRLGVGINVRDIPILFILGDSETMPIRRLLKPKWLYGDRRQRGIPMCWGDSGWVLALTYGIYQFFLFWAIRKPCHMTTAGTTMATWWLMTTGNIYPINFNFFSALPAKRLRNLLRYCLLYDGHGWPLLFAHPRIDSLNYIDTCIYVYTHTFKLYLSLRTFKSWTSVSPHAQPVL